MKAANSTKEALWEDAWRLILRGKVDRKHPFHTPVFATVSPTLHPRSRTLVLRNVVRDKAEFWCYTDRRSQKAEDIAHNPAVAWTFWAPKPQIQINVSGKAHWLETEQAHKLFSSMPQHSRKAYATLSPPGKVQAEPEDGLPEDWQDRELSATDYAADNFGVLVTAADRIEILKLSRAGHLRLLGTRIDGQNWNLHWLIP